MQIFWFWAVSGFTDQNPASNNQAGSKDTSTMLRFRFSSTLCMVPTAGPWMMPSRPCIRSADASRQQADTAREYQKQPRKAHQSDYLPF
jgi:hypothetical protein